MTSERRLSWLGRGLSLVAGCALFAATTGSAMAAGSIVVPANGTYSLPDGSSTSTPCSDLNDAGTVLINSGSLTGLANVGISSGATLNGGSGTIQLSGNWTNGGTFIPGTGTVRFNNSCSGSAPMDLGGGSTFTNLDLGAGNYTVEGCPGVTVTGNLNIGPGVTINGTNACIRVLPGGSVTGSPAGNVPINPNQVAVPALSEFGLAFLVLLMSLFGMQGVMSSRGGTGSKFSTFVLRIRKGSRHV